jgi:hypothetical protein
MVSSDVMLKRTQSNCLRLSPGEHSGHRTFAKQRPGVLRAEVVGLTIGSEAYRPSRLSGALMSFLDRQLVGSRWAGVVDRISAAREAATNPEV